jgi:hypothetical protein
MVAEAHHKAHIYIEESKHYIRWAQSCRFVSLSTTLGPPYVSKQEELRILGSHNSISLWPVSSHGLRPVSKLFSLRPTLHVRQIHAHVLL